MRLAKKHVSKKRNLSEQLRNNAETLFFEHSLQTPCRFYLQGVCNFGHSQTKIKYTVQMKLVLKFLLLSLFLLSQSNLFSQIVNIEDRRIRGTNDSTYWDSVRPVALSDQEQLTYHILDSINEEVNLDRFLELTMILAKGKVPLGKFQIDLDRLYSFNSFEGHRFGLGLSTSDKLSRWFSVGGYFAYGLQDQEEKWLCKEPCCAQEANGLG